MDATSRQKLVNLYERALKRNGTTVHALLWNTAHSQRTRFAVLLEAAPATAWEGASLADIGSGLADLYGYLQDRGWHIRYTGYDIAPRMVEAARQKYPGVEVAVRDILEEGLGEGFDYVVASGTFNIRVAGHDRFLERMIAAMYAGCRRAVAFNLLAPSPFDELGKNDMYYEADPETVLAYCRTLCGRVELREGYLPWDYTIYMYKEPAAEGPGPAGAGGL